MSCTSLNIDNFKGDSDIVAICLLDALESYSESSSLDKMKQLFGEYFSEYDRVDDFLTQIKRNYFDRMSAEQKIFFSKVYQVAFSKYNLNEYHKETLLFLLDFMLYSNTYNILPHLKEIWKKLEQDFNDENTRSFALEILRYVSSSRDLSVADDFIAMVESRQSFHLDFAMQVLLVRSKYDINHFSRLIDKFIKMGWSDYEDEDFFTFAFEYLVEELGLQEILNEYNTSVYLKIYVLRYFLPLKNMRIISESDTDRYDIHYNEESFSMVVINPRLEALLIRNMSMTAFKDHQIELRDVILEFESLNIPDNLHVEEEVA